MTPTTYDTIEFAPKIASLCSVGSANQSAYALGAQSIAADASIYSYGAICSGNASGNCGGSGGVVLGVNNAAAAVNIPNSGNTVFNNGGTVGINTSSPNAAYKLDVQGGTINSSGGFCIAGDCKTSWAQVGGGGSSQWSNNSNGINYSSGNVGIGTASPGAKLDVQGAIANNRNWFYLAEAGDTNHAIGNISGDGEQFRYWQFLDFYSPLGGGNVRLLSNGNVGIGTTSPGKTLEVAAGNGSNGITPPTLRLSSVEAATRTLDLTPPSFSAAGRINSSSTNGLAIDVGGTSDVIFLTSGNVGIGTSTPNSQYKLDVAGNINSSATITGNNIVAKYQDMAEWVPSSEKLTAGTVVVLDVTKSNQVIASTTAYDTRVAGVISAQPGITLGEKSDDKVLVATTGRVRVMVDATKAPINIGDLLVTSDVPGMAMKSEPITIGNRKMHMPGTIIGKALEPLAKGKGEILVLLSLQ